VVSPTVDGSTVQATSVWATSDSKAVVSYAMVGSQALGAVDYFIQLANGSPKLKSSLTFSDSDVYAVFADGESVYAAASTSDPTFVEPAILERIQLNGVSFSLDGPKGCRSSVSTTARSWDRYPDPTRRPSASTRRSW
jgi:hypothetical protein